MEKDYKVLEIQFINEEPKIEFELEKAGVDDKHIAIVSEYNSSIDEIEDFVKTLNIRRSL